MSMGLNRFVIHTSVHQPVNDKIPGLGLGPFGQWFTRHETWAEQARVWTTYLARSSYMLQQGRFVADIAYYYGEDSNVTALFQGNPPPIPAGFNFDYVNSDVVKNRLSVSPVGVLTTATGMNYRVLALDPNSQRMPLAVLRRIRDMVNAGAVVVGPKPIESPSLSDDAGRVQDDCRSVVGRYHGQGQGADRQHCRRACVAEGRGRLRVHEAAGRHRAGVRAPQARRRRRVLGEPPEQPRGGRRSHLPRAGQGPGPLACRDGHGRTRVLQDSKRPHYRVADAAAERRRVRGVPQGCRGAVARSGEADGNDALGRGGFLGRRVPAEPRRARHDHAPRPRVVARERRRGREVLLRHRHLHEDDPGPGGLVPGRREAVARPRRREEHCRSHGQRQTARHLSGRRRSAWT